MKHRNKETTTVLGIGSKVRAKYDHQPFATPDLRKHYTEGEIGRVVGIRENGAIEIRFADGIPSRAISNGTNRRIAFDRRDFQVIG